MRPRAWSLSAACALALLTVVALVSWRGAGVAPTWSSALRATAVVAVVALALAALVCGVVALRPPPPDRVSIAVAPDAPPSTTVAPHPGPARWLVAALALAVLGTVPVLLVLVLSATDGASAPGAASGPVATSPTSPSATAAPTTSPGTGPDPSSVTTSPPAAPSTATSAPGTATAPTTSPEPPTSGTSPSSEDLRPSTPQPPGAPDGAAAGPPPSGCNAVVVPGDTLWDLALVRLPSGATLSQVAAATGALYAANAAVVGPDPDLILPGQVLDTCA